MRKWANDIAIAWLGVLIFCSCATKPGPSSIKSKNNLPADVKMNRDAGRGNLIFVPLRLEDGKELPFILDTGASGTCFDKSLESKLGKRLGTKTLWHIGERGEGGIYAAPKLYLGNCLLQMTGSNVMTVDLKQIAPDIGHPVAGILGIDVLEHYCIQLDFVANKIHFLDSEHVDKSGWGKAFSLSIIDECPVINYNLAGSKSPGSLVDTGCHGSGWLIPRLFEQWTNQAKPSAEGQAQSPNGVLDGEMYPDVYLQGLDKKVGLSGDLHMAFNTIGLRFLARHLVTLDFPKQRLYLKRVSVLPLVLTVKEQRAEAESALMLLRRLKWKGQLPGWQKTGGSAATATFYCITLESGRFDFSRKGDAYAYHYYVIRASERGPWKLQKAWRTDKAGHTVEEYSVPGCP